MAEPVIRDDTPVAPETVLYRRVVPAVHLKPRLDQALAVGQCRRVTSALFKSRPRGAAISVVLDDDLRNSCREPTSILNPHYPEQFLIRFPASGAISLKLSVVRSSDVLGREPAHGDLVGNLTDGGAKKLIGVSEWEHSPPDACGRPSGKPAPLPVQVQ